MTGAGAGRPRSTLADVLPALLRALGEPGPDRRTGPAAWTSPPSGRPRCCWSTGWARSCCASTRTTPRSWPRLPDAGPLRTGFPSSTSISLASLGTGLPPGAHGMIGISLPGRPRRAAGQPALDQPRRRPAARPARAVPARAAAARADRLRAGGGRRHRGAGGVAADLRRLRADPGGAARRRVPRHPGPRRPGRGDHRRGRPGRGGGSATATTPTSTRSGTCTARARWPGGCSWPRSTGWPR